MTVHDDRLPLGRLVGDARVALGLAADKSVEEIDRDRGLKLALAHVLQMVGLSAERVSATLRAARATVPWDRLIGLQRAVRLDSRVIDATAAWEAVNRLFPTALPALEELLRGLPEPVLSTAPTLSRSEILDRLAVSEEALREVCRRRGIAKLRFFGSVLRPDFSPASDVDVLVEFGPGHRPTGFGLARLQDELSALLKRPVDLHEPAGLSPYLRDRVLDSAEVVLVA